ncbi:MAG: methyltransferase domain-containing protein, partial [Thermaurantiacus sp.]
AVAALEKAGLSVELADIPVLRAVEGGRVTLSSRAAPPTLRFLDRLTAGWPAGAELRVLDVGVGQGGMLRSIHRWARGRGLVPRLTGLDLNPRCLAAARAATPADMEIAWAQADALAYAPAQPPHAIVTSLFMHHLSDAEVLRFLRWQEQAASHGWFVNDLHRHWFAWGGFWLLSRAARWHRFVQHDGPLSVRRAFVRAEWQELLAAAGISGAEVRWNMPFRLCVSRLRQP